MVYSISQDYYAVIQQIEDSGLPARDKYIQLKRLLEISCKEITASESLQFPSFFSRLVFIAQRFNLPKTLEWQLQHIRVQTTFLQQDEKRFVTDGQYQMARSAVLRLWRYVSGSETSEDDFQEMQSEHNMPEVLDKIRVQVTAIDRENQLLICVSADFVGEELVVSYGDVSINDQFDETIERLWIGAQMNLIDVRRNEQGKYIPHSFVLEPDYLIDASAVAECFQNYGNSHLHYFRRKFDQPTNTHYILLGNLANFFLDELLYVDDPRSLNFQDVFIKSFRHMPFEYASCKDIQSTADFKDFMARAYVQFTNIKRVVLEDMPQGGFDLTNCILEPSFYCEKYGFQGRLDLLQIPSSSEDIYRIIELKSGKPPYPREDVTKIAPNHEIQTMIYRLMIQTVFGTDSRHVYAAILYSSAENKGENIRLAAAYKKLEKELLNIRNLIVATEHDLYVGGCEAVSAEFEELFDRNNYGRIPDFFNDRLTDLQVMLTNLSEVEKAYFFQYISFISRELYLQKVGDEGYDSPTSTSSLWNTSFADRQNALEVISDLEIEEVDNSGRDMTIRFHRFKTTDCVNFREGEICILYPRDSEKDSLMTNQILKGNLVEITDEYVTLRFRHKQRNRRLFNEYRFWVVEHDRLDHSYNAMYRSLAAFLRADKSTRDLLLGLRRPESDYEYKGLQGLDIQQKQDEVINKALLSKDYFLIVGPPGTGKTSIFARRLIEELYRSPERNILVIAYTNRAVDELCAAICAAFGKADSECNKYIRIGTELSCSEAYRHRLLQNISQGVQNRDELLSILASQRIFVGTQASIVGKPEIFDLKHFEIAIIDEASQILEPQIIGLLPCFDRFIMIGDHKQLSTITLQNEDKSAVINPLLNEIGLFDCRESLFERLYRTCQSNGWTDNYDTLTYHGRMHEDVADFVNKQFYENQLRVATLRQKEKLPFGKYIEEDKIQSLLAKKRIAFIPSRNLSDIGKSDKMNHAEADRVVDLVRSLKELYANNRLSFDPQKTIGIITPYRNQIALIRQKLIDANVVDADRIMIDTIERYQGSQRDVIIVSCCFNRFYQLRFFSNMNKEGTVDRKLNVALTRAREQLFIIGNDILMSKKTLYRKMIEEIGLACID